MPTTVLGKVYSPDPDDWDNKTYVFEGHVPRYIITDGSVSQQCLSECQ